MSCKSLKSQIVNARSGGVLLYNRYIFAVRALNIHIKENAREPARILSRSRAAVALSLSLSRRAVNCGSLVRINGLAVCAAAGGRAGGEHDQAAGRPATDFMNY